MTVQVRKNVQHKSKGDATACVHVHAYCRPHIGASATAANPYQEESRTWQASCNVPKCGPVFAEAPPWQHPDRPQPHLRGVSAHRLLLLTLFTCELLTLKEAA